MITTVHHHDDVRIFHKQAKSLTNHGYNVTILNPEFEGEKENIRFVRCTVPQKRWLRILFSWLSAYKAAKGIDANAYMLHDPELLPLGRLLKKQGAKLLFDFHEDVQLQIKSKPYLVPEAQSSVQKLYRFVEKQELRHFDAIVTATEPIAERYSNAVVIHNYPDAVFHDVKDDYLTRKDYVCYVGSISKSRGIFEMVEAVAGSQAKLLLAGAFESGYLENQVRKLEGFAKVEFEGYLGREQTWELLNRAKAGILTLHNTASYAESMPIKLFEYMLCGLPLIVSDFPYWRDKLLTEDYAVFVDPLSPIQIKNAISYLIENPDIAKRMGEKARAAALEKYRWNREEGKLIRLYERLL